MAIDGVLAKIEGRCDERRWHVTARHDSRPNVSALVGDAFASRRREQRNEHMEKGSKGRNSVAGPCAGPQQNISALRCNLGAMRAKATIWMLSRDVSENMTWGRRAAVSKETRSASRRLGGRTPMRTSPRPQQQVATFENKLEALISELCIRSCCVNTSTLPPPRVAVNFAVHFFEPNLDGEFLLIRPFDSNASTSSSRLPPASLSFSCRPLSARCRTYSARS
ncbi:hypothetical protein BCR34DRAFT_358647 [Clohesyomyces aquaticus]|uniref:Uncharacterized protein n=1 Tax=Clohesyomyces aquaticus TaxID=1231657 RepID=A0A1Y1ZI77_9PLEO|nr:hypothetical protein BCR34DRAFT_358647 [Clohesyomyces aquaticus]